MRTKRWAGLLALVLLLSLCGGALATAARVYDGADLFTASEEAALEEEIARFQEETGMDFVVVTSVNPRRTESSIAWPTSFTSMATLAWTVRTAGVLYYIDMYNRYQYIYTRGQMIDYLSRHAH